jgi:hypothetical protein
MAPLASSGPQLESLISLFLSDKSRGLHERHCAALTRLTTDSSDGFALIDLPKAQKILELTLGLLKAGGEASSQFSEPCIKLLRALGRPFVKKAATDEIKLVGNAADIMLAIGMTFELPDQAHKPLKLAASEVCIANALEWPHN